MTCIEHALENAINAVKKEHTFEIWKSTDPNLEHINATPEEIWELAIYVVYSYKPLYLE